ncbi:MAG: N-methyl-L-tryptophan oxidase [Bacteroidetes bacterium]|nr:N-methyl-L-tryptophan oxidase [Bacteroidota bacterium]
MSLVLSLSDLLNRVSPHIEKSQAARQKKYDVIVLGVGSMGSSSCYYLAKQGLSVLGIEQFSIPHEGGSHAGQSRIIRKAYFEHPNYVPLLEAAYKNWKDLETETGIQLYFKTGLLYFGKPESPLIKGLKLAAEKYKVPIQPVSVQEMKNRFSSFQIPSEYERMMEPDAGFVTPERAILAYTERALQLGASIHVQEKTLAWKKSGNTFIITTDKNTYQCEKLVITAGAWAGKMVTEVANKLQVTRQIIGWMKPKINSQFQLEKFPCWTLADPEKPGIYYGFPILPSSTFGGITGLKLGHHTPGISTDPDQTDRNPVKEDEANLIAMLSRFIPEGYASTAGMKSCLYTYTPDENFVIDFVPGTDNGAVMAAGFSGHGFKFASIVGEIMADLVIKKTTDQPIAFLNADRLGKKG